VFPPTSILYKDSIDEAIVVSSQKRDAARAQAKGKPAASKKK
jgi:hypothetical protein